MHRWQINWGYLEELAGRGDAVREFPSGWDVFWGIHNMDAHLNF